MKTEPLMIKWIEMANKVAKELEDEKEVQEN